MSDGSPRPKDENLVRMKTLAEAARPLVNT